MINLHHNWKATRRPRAGVTILEALIAIGIATIGLFGVFAILPVASQQSQQGLIDDHKSFLGQNAFQEFEARAFDHPQMWLYTNMNAVADGNSPTGFTWNNRPPTAFAPVRNPNVNPPYVPPRASFCIDPRFFFSPPLPAVQGPPQFPNATNASITMPRITVRATPTANVGMGVLMADEVFVSDDDLVFDPTDDVLTTAEQEYVVDETTTPNKPIKRAARGLYAWMATVVPRYIDPAAPNGTADLYTLSIVVYYTRDMGALERVAEVDSFDGGGIGGGDMTISGQTPDDVNIRRGDWVMLSQRVPTSNQNIPVHKWYRVIAAETDESDTLTQRYITLLGRDIDPTLPTQVTLAKGVVAVYEKTIRLESSSNWQP